MVRSVRVGTSEERTFVQKHAPLYIDLDDLKRIRERVEARRDFEVSHASGTALDEDEPAPPVEMSDIEKNTNRASTNPTPAKAKKGSLLER